MSENTVKNKKGLWGPILIGAFFIYVLLWLSDPGTSEQTSIADTPDKLKVTTMMVKPQSHQIEIDITGVAQSRWPLTVIAAVSGRVDQFPADMVPGTLINQGEPLLSINDAAYRSEVANAAARVKQAELEVARIKREQHIAKNTARGANITSYGRFEPHLAAAQAQLTAAKSSLNYAKEQLKETRILAPFDAVVLQKQVVPGQWINSGDQLFMLAASDSIDIQAEISYQQLKQLQGLNLDTQVSVHTHHGLSYDAKLRYIDPNLSNTTRQSNLVFYVEQPEQNSKRLKANDMVTLTIKGAKIEHVVAAPTSALTPDGDVWLVENGKLQKQRIEIQQEFTDKVYFTFAQSSEGIKELVRFPTSSMLAGQSVISETDGDKQ